MSDAAAPETGGKKKGGKLPIILVLGAMLAAGGYFGMQSRAPKGVEKEPEAELGAIVELAPEFIVNLREREYFLRASIAIQLDKHSKLKLGGDAKGKEKGPSPEMIALRDAVTERLSTLSVTEIRQPDFYTRLRRVLAADANRTLALISHKEEEKSEKESKKSKKDKDKDEDEEEKPKAKVKPTLATVTINPAKLDHPDWDSDEGPVLKVYVTAFATQRE